MENKTTIQKLISFKNRTGIKWSTISTMIGTNKYTLSRWVNGKNKPISVYDKIILKIIEKSS